MMLHLLKISSKVPIVTCKYSSVRSVFSFYNYSKERPFFFYFINGSTRSFRVVMKASERKDDSDKH